MTTHLQSLLERCQREQDNPSLLYEIGSLYLVEKQDKLASDYLKKALTLDPSHPQILMQLGNAASNLLDFKFAAECFAKSLKIDPKQDQVHFNLGNVLHKLKHLQQAAEHYLVAIRLNPNEPDYYNNLGMVYLEARKLNKAVSAFAEVIKRQPMRHETKSQWLHQKQHMADWHGLKQTALEIRQAVRQKRQDKIPPFIFLGVPGVTDSEQLDCASMWAQLDYGHIQAMPPPNKQVPGSKINIAYLSSDFKRHPIPRLVTDVIASHDAQAFNVIVYSQSVDDGSQERQAAKAASPVWIDIMDMTDDDVAADMRARDIDILIDLTGYTNDNRSGIAAYRPARLHVNWLGFPGTMGMLNGQPFFDRIIVDETLAHLALAEKPIVLPCYFPNNAVRPLAQPTTRAENGLPEQGFVFCSFNQSFKVTPDVFACWMQILQAVPGSILWMLETNPWAKKNFILHTQAAGVSPERIVFAPFAPIDQHMARLGNADLMLDTMPYNAHTTACDALWREVPIISVEGNTFSSRVSSSLLKRIGLQELICHSLEDYTQRAIDIANTPAWLARLKDTIRQNNHALFTPTTFVRGLEAELVRHLAQACGE